MANPTRESVQHIATFLADKGFFVSNPGFDIKLFTDQLHQEAVNVFNSDNHCFGNCLPDSQWDAIFLQFEKIGANKNISVEFSFLLDHTTQTVEFANLNAVSHNMTRSYGRCFASGHNWKPAFPTLKMIEQDLQRAFSQKPRKFNKPNRNAGKML